MNFALIGYPLGHSMSAYIHRQLFALSGCKGSYELCPLPREQLDLSDIMSRYDGVNVTIPYKTEVIPFLDRLDEKSRILHSVNTIKLEDNKLVGYNTDYTGFCEALQQAKISLNGKNVLLCGYGGTARMMLHIAARCANSVSILVREGRSAAAQKLADEAAAQGYGADIKITEQTVTDCPFDVILNATPCGMYPDRIGIMAVPEQTVAQCEAVFDAVYNPRNTALVTTAVKHGKRVGYGMTMLVYQAAAAHNIWYGASFSKNQLDRLVQFSDEKMIKEFQ